MNRAFLQRLAGALMTIAVLAAACRERPDARLLADERLAGAVEEIVFLYSQRTGQRIRVALASPERLGVMLPNGKDDLVLAEARQLDARPATSGLDRDSRREVASRDGDRFAVVMRHHALEKRDARAFWLFLQGSEAGAILSSKGFHAPPAPFPGT